MEQPQNKLQLTTKLIAEQPSVRALLDLPQIKDNWVKTYEKVTGRNDGELRWNAEYVLFLKRVDEDNSLKNADKFSIYTAISELAISGGTLRDGICYVVAFGKKAQFLPGYKFRLEQIDELDSVVHCHQPQVVYDCDEFIYHKGMKVVIEKHEPGTRTEKSIITHAYFVVEFTFGPMVYIMERIDILKIRDQYSKSWKAWVADCRTAQKNPEENQTFQLQKQGYNGPYMATIEPPMWIKDEAEAFKKTVILRAWKAIPGKLKKAKHRFIDEQLQKAGVNSDLEPDDLDNMILKPEQDQQQGQQQPEKPESKEKPQPENKPGKQPEKASDELPFEEIPRDQPPANDVDDINAGF